MSDAPERPRVIDGTDRAYREWEDSEADRRRDQWTQARRGMDAERRGRRAELSTFALHRHALERAARLSTVSAGSVEPSRGHADSAAPPRQATLDEHPVWRERWRVIRAALERVHELLDEAEGHSIGAATDLTTEEKDRRILVDGRGYSCEAVVMLLGRDVAGSASTVRRKRANTRDPDSRERRLLGHAVRTSDGEPLDAAIQPGVRRVRFTN